MPTGYTADLYDGEQDFEAFVLQAARGMGALITMRDDPWGTPIPEAFKPDTSYHDEHLEEARLRLAFLSQASNEELDREAEESYQSQLKRYHNDITKTGGRLQRYREMSDKIEQWDVPELLDSFKKFMLDQLAESIRFDGYVVPEPKRLSVEEYKATQIEKAEWDISYHTKHIEGEIERTNARNEWLKALRTSLDKVKSSI